MTSAFFRWFHNTHPLPSSCHQHSYDSRLPTHLSSFVIFKTFIYSLCCKRQLAFWNGQKQSQGNLKTVKLTEKQSYGTSHLHSKNSQKSRHGQAENWENVWKVKHQLVFFLKLKLYIVVRQTSFPGFFLCVKKGLRTFHDKRWQTISRKFKYSRWEVLTYFVI